MKITYISSFNAESVLSYSGTGYYIPKKLKEAGDEVEYIGELSKENPFFQKVKRRLYSYSGKNYLIERNPGVLRSWAKRIERELKPATEVIVGYSSQPFSQLFVNKPKVFWSDAVFANMIDYYPVYSNLCKESISDGNKMENQALMNTDIAVFSSDWAAKAAIDFYGIPEQKVKVVTYGANIDVDFTLEDIRTRAKKKSQSECNLLFIGVEWYRKGGDIAVEVTRLLKEKGINATLSILGVNPGKEIESLDFVKSYGFISKSDTAGQEMFKKIVADSHFLLLPTRADCTPIVYSEFNAHGIPVITTNEGGIPNLVKDGINGFMFSKNTAPDIFAEKIAELFTDKKLYVELCESSFNEYKTRLNWDFSINQFRNILKQLI